MFLVKSSQYPEVITIITFIATSILSQRLKLREFEEGPGLTQALGHEHTGSTEHSCHLRRLPKVSGGAELPQKVSTSNTFLPVSYHTEVVFQVATLISSSFFFTSSCSSHCPQQTSSFFPLWKLMNIYQVPTM